MPPVKAPSYPLKGINTTTVQGLRPVRKDIDTWYKEQTKEPGAKRIQLTLLIEALAAIQALPLNDRRSWFRIAGIHSQPWVEWDNADPPDGPTAAQQKNKVPGYCVHNDYTFPTWHRLYVLLLEQVLYEAMNDFIQKNVPSESMKEWQNEADQWRLPYWDFAKFANRAPASATLPKDSQLAAPGELRLPILLVKPNVEIRSVSKNTKGPPAFKTVSNPFYKYTAPKLMGSLDNPYKIVTETREDKKNKTKWTIPWDKCISTTKYGLLDGYHVDIWADGGQNWLRSNLALNEHAWNPKPANPKHPAMEPQQTVQYMVWRLLQQTGGPASWTAFSSTRYSKNHEEKPEYWLSLEMIHNNIHAFVGGSQFIRPDEEHMKLWGMGHMASPLVAAFDPIFFIYHCNIDRLTATWQALNPTKWFDGESAATRANDLTPFSKDTQRTTYKSDDVRDWRQFGYDYEIVQDTTTNQHKNKPVEQIKKEIDHLYSQRTLSLFPYLRCEGDENDYIVTVRYDRYALNGEPYKIHLFLGDIPTDTSSIGPETPNFVASVYNFSTPLPAAPPAAGEDSGGGCGNCQQQRDEGIKSVAQVPATYAVDRYKREKNVDPIEAKEKLSYAVVDNLGCRVDMHGSHDSQNTAPIVKMYRTPRATFLHEVHGHEDTEYEKIGTGRQAVTAAA